MERTNFFCILKVTENIGTNPYPDPYQNVTDPEHWKTQKFALQCFMVVF
jgi:hypothetical protein